MLEENTKVNDFTLEDQDGNKWTLSDNLDKTIILYFYPKDNTPGCTTQACTYRDFSDEFLKYNAKVVGISADSVASHEKFIAKQSLNFTLLSDPEKEVIQSFGAYGEKNMFGKKVMGIIRSSFIINQDGVIEKVFKKASPKNNAQEIIDYFESR